MMPGMQNGEQPDGQTPPEMPEMNARGGRMMPGMQNGEQPDGQTPPEMPDMDARGGRMMPGMNGKWAKASDWAEEELNKAYDKNLIPDSLNNDDLTEYVTRKEFAHIIIKLYEALTGKKAEEISENPFSDTNDSEVLKAYNLGISNGTSATTFSPDDFITREEIAVMTTRAVNAAGINTEFDMDSVSRYDDEGDMHEWGKRAIYFMSCNNIVKGTGNNLFDVKGTATKEQALLICERSVENFAKA